MFLDSFQPWFHHLATDTFAHSLPGLVDRQLNQMLNNTQHLFA